jgi:hypothetical protein
MYDSSWVVRSEFLLDKASIYIYIHTQDSYNMNDDTNELEMMKQRGNGNIV